MEAGESAANVYSRICEIGSSRDVVFPRKPSGPTTGRLKILPGRGSLTVNPYAKIESIQKNTSRSPLQEDCGLICFLPAGDKRDTLKTGRVEEWKSGRVNGCRLSAPGFEPEKETLDGAPYSPAAN